VRDPEIIKNILVKDFHSFHDHGLFKDEDIEPLSGHLFLIGGSRWKNLRAKLTPTFTSGKMKMMFQTLVDCGHELGSILEKSANNKEIIEIKDLMARYSTDIISSAAFGIKCNCLKNPDAEFRQWGRKFFAPSIRNAVTAFLNETIPNLMGVLKVTPIDYKIARYFQSMVNDTVNYREKNNITRNDFLQLLIQIKNKVKVSEKNEIPEMNGYGNLEDKSSEDGMYVHFVFFLATFSIVFALQFKPLHNVKHLSQIPSQFSFHNILLEGKKSHFWHIYQCFRTSHIGYISNVILHFEFSMTNILVSSKAKPLKNILNRIISNLRICY
jgi:cytochrome P450 family 6